MVASAPWLWTPLARECQHLFSIIHLQPRPRRPHQLRTRPSTIFQPNALDAVFDEHAPRIIVDLPLERTARDLQHMEELERLECIAERGGMVPADCDAENGNRGLHSPAAPVKARKMETYVYKGSSDLTNKQYLRRQAALCALVSLNGGLCHWDTEMAVATGPPT